MKNDIINENKKYKLNRPITGNISEDRIWEQWYHPDIFKEKLPKMNQRDYLFKCNSDYKDQVIINNRGKKKITINKFEEMVNRFTASLIAHEIGKGDFVVSISLSTPELIALKYACATIGAITANMNFMDAQGNSNNNTMYRQLKLLNPSIIFTLDILENKVSEVLNLEEFKGVKKVILPLAKSTPFYNNERIKVKLLQGINKIKNVNINNSISLNTFLRAGTPYRCIQEESIYYNNMPSNIAFTSGTTGESKAVLLSHDANNALAMQHKLAGLGLERGKTNMALVPPFLAFWDADIIHMAMCLGIEEILELSLTYDNIPKYLSKYLPNYGIWSQYLWDSILSMKKEDLEKVSANLEKCVVGGERADINQANTFKRITGIDQIDGYGASEMDSCFSVAHPNCNIVGSAGLPLPFNNVRIVDENFNDLTYNERGRILITGPAQMLGYYARKDLTDKVLIKDKGVIWYDTKDYGYVDMTGSLFPLDRDSEAIVLKSDTQTETKEKLINISEEIKECQYIKLCKTNYYNGIIVSHVSFDDFIDISIEEMKQNMLETINNSLPKYKQPHIINLLPTLPRTQLGKVDYPLLDNMTEEIVLSEIDNIDNEQRLKIIDNIKMDKMYIKHI